MKKILVLILATMMVLTFIPVASAQQHMDEEKTSKVIVSLSMAEGVIGETGMCEASLHKEANAEIPTNPSPSEKPEMVTWERTFGGSRDDMAFSIVQTTDGGYALTGEPNPRVPGGEISGS